MEADTFTRFKSLLVRYMDRKDMEGYGPDTGKSGSLDGQQKILYHFNGDLRTYKKTQTLGIVGLRRINKRQVRFQHPCASQLIM